MRLLAEITDESLGLPGESPVSPAERKAARAVLVDDDGRVAVMALDKFDFYMLPGGGIEDGEDAQTACIREMKEETGCECIITGELGIGMAHADGGAPLGIVACARQQRDI